jgi:hypothetical protein
MIQVFGMMDSHAYTKPTYGAYCCMASTAVVWYNHSPHTLQHPAVPPIAPLVLTTCPCNISASNRQMPR